MKNESFIGKDELEIKLADRKRNVGKRNFKCKNGFRVVIKVLREVIMKKLFTQLVFSRNEKVDKDIILAELESAREQMEWSLRF